MNRIWATLKIALRALLRNKMRTLLTMLGMIIGVAAVIAMVSIGNGAKSQIEASIASMGQNVVLVFSGSVTPGRSAYRLGQRRHPDASRMRKPSGAKSRA